MSVLRGAQAPERVQITIANIESDPDPLDLTGVSAAVISVAKPSGQLPEEWSATIASQSASELVLEHVFDAADVEQPGAYLLTISLTVLDGVRRAGPVTLQVF